MFSTKILLSLNGVLVAPLHHTPYLPGHWTTYRGPVVVGQTGLHTTTRPTAWRRKLVRAGIAASRLTTWVVILRGTVVPSRYDTAVAAASQVYLSFCIDTSLTANDRS